jgi:hypothetical protein
MAIPPLVPTRMTSGCWKVDSAGAIGAPTHALQLFQRQILYAYVRVRKYCNWSTCNGNHLTNSSVSYLSTDRGRIEIRIDDFRSMALLLPVKCSVIDL